MGTFSQKIVAPVAHAADGLDVAPQEIVRVAVAVAVAAALVAESV